MVNDRDPQSDLPAGFPQHRVAPKNRREFLCQAGAGFGSLALLSLLARDGVISGAERQAPLNPLAPRKGHFDGTAKSVIFLFMDGGPSHLDTFDPKPKVNELAGQPLPKSIERVITPMGVSENPLLASKRNASNSSFSMFARSFLANRYS